MYIAQLLYPVKVLGPGNRIGIWFAGCKHGCKECSNPELWAQPSKYCITKDKLLHLIESITAARPVDGFTLTGGEPFLQPDALREILPELNKISSDILIYSGYKKDELLALGYSDLLEQIAVLIDGKYIKELNDNSFLRGASNQEIHILNEAYKDYYQNYINTSVNEIQNFMTKTDFVSVGIHRAEYKEELNESLKKKGLVSDNN